MNARREGYRVVYDPEAIATDYAPEGIEGEFTRRVRLATGSFTSLIDLLRVPMGIRAVRICFPQIATVDSTCSPVHIIGEQRHFIPPTHLRRFWASAAVFLFVGRDWIFVPETYRKDEVCAATLLHVGHEFRFLVGLFRSFSKQESYGSA